METNAQAAQSTRAASRVGFAYCLYFSAMRPST
jgi:hypothetical protein